MALANYADLVSAVQSYCDDTSDGFVALIPNFVTLAEAEFNRTLRTDDMVAASTVTASTESTALPDGFNGLLSIDVDGSPDWPLTRLALPELKAVYPTTTTGKPQAYAIADGKLWWGPVPDASYTVNLVYSATIAGLEASSTNWLMTSHPDLYLAGTLAQAYAQLLDEQRAALWLGRAEALIAQINKDSIKKTAGASSIAPKGIVAQVRGVRI